MYDLLFLLMSCILIVCKKQKELCNECKSFHLQVMKAMRVEKKKNLFKVKQIYSWYLLFIFNLKKNYIELLCLIIY